LKTQIKCIAQPHHCLVTQKLHSTYFNVLYAYFIIGPNVWSHCGFSHKEILCMLVVRWYTSGVPERPGRSPRSKSDIRWMPMTVFRLISSWLSMLSVLRLCLKLPSLKNAFPLPYWVTLCKTVRPMLSVRCLSCLSVTFVHCGQTGLDGSR